MVIAYIAQTSIAKFFAVVFLAFVLFIRRFVPAVGAERREEVRRPREPFTAAARLRILARAFASPS